MRRWVAVYSVATTIAMMLAIPLVAQTSLKTVWDGAYTDAQAKRGESVYSEYCSRCHAEDLTGQQSRLVGDRFMRDWREDTLSSLFRRMRSTMPRGMAGRLADSQYLDVVAYVLQANEFPSGSGELTSELAPTIMLIGKDGPQPVPEFSLVQLTGCLGQSGSDWMLTRASDPFRSRTPELTADDLTDPRVGVSGVGTFKLLEATAYKPELHKDHMVAVKGLLIRRPENRLNVTALDTLAPSCTP